MDDNNLQPNVGTEIPASVNVPAVPIEAAPFLAPAIPIAGPAEAANVTPKQRRAFGRGMRIAGLLMAIGLCAFGYVRAQAYGQRVLQAHPVDARIEISNPPAWLDRRIVGALLDEAYQFAQGSEENYNRTRDIQDNGILQKYAEIYTGSDTVGDKTVSRQSKGYNAWIQKVVHVHRDITKDNGMQSIEIEAQWREPAVWIREPKGTEMALYLIDAEGTRLPGDYRPSDRGNSPLMVLAGVDIPDTGVPAPGEKWFTKTGAIGDDLAGGMKLIELLQTQKFANQIAAVNVANFSGRMDFRGSWINLETVWAAAGDVPRVVQWGRPAGEEKYYEIQAPSKLKTLKDIFAKFGRIDAGGRDTVDLRTDFVYVAKPTLPQTVTPPPARPTRG